MGADGAVRLDEGKRTANVTAAPHLLRRAADRERLLAYALTAADLLLETDGEGLITFAAGTFSHRLGEPPEAWLGRPAAALIAPADRPAFTGAFGLLTGRGRLPPSAFRLNDAAGTPVAIAGLMLPQAEGASFCLTVAPMPLPPAEARATPAGTSLTREAETRLRQSAPNSTLGLIALEGPDGPFAPRPELAESIGAALGDGHALTGELAQGRYGVLSASAADIADIAARIEDVLHAAGAPASVAQRALALQSNGLSALQATRALRFALSTFAAGGPAATDRAGFRGGLAGFVTEACTRATHVRAAIEERRFRLAFQPIVRLADSHVHHYEALLRPLPSESVPMAAAQDFVTFAETVGLSEDLDWAVVETVCEAARQAKAARIACNLSGLSLQSPDFRKRLLTLLDTEPGLVPRLLVEITETAEIEDMPAAVMTAEELRRRGLPLCIDDFGAGFAAFRTLRAFPVDYVKIDGLYVQNAMRSQQDRGFLAAMVDLARSVGAAVVAERIETLAEAQAMRELGVTYGQGWLFGRPGALPGNLGR